MKRPELKSILIIGAGPIVIGQACEFDYSGTQACKILRMEGHRVILVNSNPATIMTDPETADVTYVEPLTLEVLEMIIAKERPDAILPTLGGQTALNLGMSLHNQGILKKYGVEMLGANAKAIHMAEDRSEFKKAMDRIGLESARSLIAYSYEEASAAAKSLGFPCVVRPAYTLGGSGGGIAYDEKDLHEIVASGLRNSMIREVLIEESIIGWKEYELEVMRDKADNVVIICSIENLDPMGVHTGDSITVAPAQTLSDREYQIMRDASIAIMREIGVETGGSNVQFAVNPADGRMIVIEMNPRVSRSSALASKATGFPIAKFAAKLAIGYTLDEILNDITKKTPACFEPSIDYVVTKIPRFNFEKFEPSSPLLGTAMKSVGEAMSIGRTFQESLQKGLRSMENKRFGLGFDGRDFKATNLEFLLEKLKKPNPERIHYIKLAFENGFNVSQIHDFTKIDPWFLNQIEQIVKAPATFTDDADSVRGAKKQGFSDRQLAEILKYPDEMAFRKRRESLGIKPVYKLVDTCAGEFEAQTPYYYSTYEEEDEVAVSSKKKVMILGGGPNRIGQGIEFDYCCVHAAMALGDAGYESIMVNSNPETVSTDYDTSDRLYFEPLTLEDVLNIVHKEKPEGAIIQFGGQTPLNLAVSLEKAGVKILGTSSDSIDRAEDRERFKTLLKELNLKQPENKTVTTVGEAAAAADQVGYPVVVRPSYVLGGASMKICWSEQALVGYMQSAKDVSPSHPILLDHYLVDAIEIDVDALSDGKDCVVAGIMEHVEEAGIHSGDSACFLPPHTLSEKAITEITQATRALALELKVIGLLNIQFAVCQGQLYVLEVNPRGSRTVPFVSKATGIQWAKMATRVILGQSIASLNLRKPVFRHWFVKEAVLPFSRFPGVDPILGPEMKSTGEVMGVDQDTGMAFYKAQLAAGQKLPSAPGDVIGFYAEDAAIRDALFTRLGSLESLGYRIEDVTSYFDDKKGANHSNTLNFSHLSLFICPPSRALTVGEKDARKLAISQQVSVITTLKALDCTILALKSRQTKGLGVVSLQEIW